MYVNFVPEFTEQEDLAWRIVRGDQQIPGSPEPVEGKCGAILRSRAIRDVEDFIGVERGSLTKRHCLREAGWGTPQAGFGPCKIHLGATPTVTKKYLPMAMDKDIHTLAELWDEALGLDPAPVEASRLVLKMKKTMLVLEQMVMELGASIEAENIQGTKQLRPILEMWERSVDRFADIIKFCLKYDLEQRRVELLESLARDIAGAVLGVVLNPHLQLTEEQLTIIRTDLSKAMQDLAPSLRPDWMEDLGFDDDQA